MAKAKNYLVLREHEGDRFYREGKTRTADPSDVKHLLGKVLEEAGDAAAADADKPEPAEPVKQPITAPEKQASKAKAPAKGK